MLHEAALATLVSDSDRAVEFAERLVEVDPYDENHHVLLVRALAVSGRTWKPPRAPMTARSFQREVGIEPTRALRDALLVPRSSSRLMWTPTRASVVAQLEAGDAAIGAGSWANGIDHLRQAVAGARAMAGDQLRARCLVRLGSALVHAARGHDEESAASLHEGGALAETCGDDRLAATAWRELAWVEFLRARHDRARLWLDRAEAAAGDDPTEAAWIAVISGASRTDLGDYPQAERDLARAIEVADAAELAAPAAFARSFQGRVHLLRDELEAAQQTLRSLVDRATDISWTAMIPWPESLLAEVHLRQGDVDTAAEMFEHAFTMGRQVGDPCWESMALGDWVSWRSCATISSLACTCSSRHR